MILIKAQVCCPYLLNSVVRCFKVKPFVVVVTVFVVCNNKKEHLNLPRMKENEKNTVK